MQTRFILLLSLLFNVALVAVSGFFVYHGHERVPAVSRIQPIVIPEIPRLQPEPTVGAVFAEPRMLRWSDLLSSDEAAYARNLRGIGCPEDTIRDILTAAIAHRFDAKRQDLTVQHQQGRLDAAAMQAAVAQSWQEQNDAVNRLSGIATGNTAGQVANSSPPSGGNLSGSPTMAVTAAPRALPPGIKMPLAVADPPASLGLSPVQTAAAVGIGDSFAKAVNSQNLAPTDPAYHQLWQNLQASADEQLKAKIGWDAFLKWQLSGSNRKNQ